MKQLMETNIRFLIVGQLSLVFGIAASILNSYFFNHLPILDFLCGLLIGLSVVMNLAFLVRYSRDRQKESR